MTHVPHINPDSQEVKRLADEYGRARVFSSLGVIDKRQTALHAAIDRLRDAAAQRLPQSDADYWLRHRAAILAAISAAGFTLVSNSAGFQLLKLGKVEAQGIGTQEGE